MFWAKRNRINLLLVQDKIYCMHNGQICAYDINNNLSSINIPYIRNCSVRIYADHLSGCEAVLNVPGSEEAVLKELSKSLCVRKPDFYDISFQTNNTAVVIWFPRLKENALKDWTKNNDFVIESLDTIANVFSFLCEENAAAVVDLDDNALIMKRSNENFTDIFSVSISDDNDIVSAYESISDHSRSKVYTSRNLSICSDNILRSFFVNNKEYDIKCWKKYILEGEHD